jgi:integrase
VITADEINEYLHGLVAKKELRPISVAGVAAVIRVLLAFAVHKRKLTVNVARGLDMPAAKTKRTRAMDEAGLRAVWRALVAESEWLANGFEPMNGPGLIDPDRALALRLLFLTMVRRNDVTGAKWAEIDFGTRLWTVPADRMKGDRPHVVPLSESAIHVLRLTKALTRDRGRVPDRGVRAEGGYGF